MNRRQPLPTFEAAEKAADLEKAGKIAEGQGLFTEDGIKAIKQWLSMNSIDTKDIGGFSNLKPGMDGIFKSKKMDILDISWGTLMQPLFKSMNVEFEFGQQDDYLYIGIKYDWAHPSGSNGYTVRAQSHDLGKRWAV